MPLRVAAFPPALLLATLLLALGAPAAAAQVQDHRPGLLAAALRLSQTLGQATGIARACSAPEAELLTRRAALLRGGDSGLPPGRVVLVGKVWELAHGKARRQPCPPAAFRARLDPALARAAADYEAARLVQAAFLPAD